MNRSKDPNNASLVRFLRFNSHATGLASKNNYENLEAREATALNEISPAVQCGAEVNKVDLNQIHVSHQFTVESREHS